MFSRLLIISCTLVINKYTIPIIYSHYSPTINIFSTMKIHLTYLIYFHYSTLHCSHNHLMAVWSCNTWQQLTIMAHCNNLFFIIFLYHIKDQTTEISSLAFKVLSVILKVKMMQHFATRSMLI